MTDQQPVDADAYAERLERLDRIGREALAAAPADAIRLVREANDLVGDLLPMHRALMAELAEHRATLQAACEELEQAGTGGDDGPTAGASPSPAPSTSQLDRLDGVGDDADAPF